MASCFSICCGEGDEEQKRGAFETPSDDWQSEQTERIRSVEDRITILSQQRRRTTADPQEARRTIFTPTINLNEHYEPPVYPKTNAQKEFLQTALQDNFLFMDLSPVEIQKLIQAMQHERFQQNDTIIKQGDVGDFFYVVESGQVDFILDGTKNVGSCQRAGSFGELALLYDCPRAVSCVAVSEVVDVWKVDQTTFRYLLAHNANDHKNSMLELLRKVTIFHDLSDEDMNRFVDSLTPVQWKNGTRIVQKGEEGKVFYILQEGQVKVHDIGLGDSQSEDLVLGPGDFFGERSLLTGERRAANVTAISEVKTMAMDRETFERVLGPLQNRLERKMRFNFLKGRPIFSKGNVTEPELFQLADLMKQVCYKKGQKLAEDGKPYQMKVWFIRHGRLLVISSKTEKIFNLASGDCFGDKSIRQVGRISSHTAICEENLTTWVLTREDIENVLGDIDRLGEATLEYVKMARDTTIRFSDLKKHTVLGEGAFGRVWLVSLKGKNTTYALKTMSKRMLMRTKQVPSVLREKEMLCLLQHPFILHLISSFQDENHVYLLLPIVPGGELFRVLHSQQKRGGGLPNKNAAFYAACIIEALGHFHQRSIAYRDLKLENVLIDADGYCKVVDLGFAKVVTDKTYTLVGTPEYLSPEIILSKGHDKAVDYWAYGILVYELLVGKSPFFIPNTSQVDMFRRAIKMQFTFPFFVNMEAQALITSLLQRRPSKRLGNLAGGYIDIKRHSWFETSDIDFRLILRREEQAPWAPEVKGDFDASNFDSYGEDQNDDYSSIPLTPEEQMMFQDF